MKNNTIDGFNFIETTLANGERIFIVDYPDLTLSRHSLVNHLNKSIEFLNTRDTSTLLEAKQGDRVRCLYGNSGHKFWTELLEQHPTVDKIQFDSGAGFCKFTFKEDSRENNWFYENDFEKI